ncbi:RraA family protein [Flavimaricola marinus]|uniref:Putative 4-hydroxy-4-methyl-2-oxoglutarate aldolase n=1 Tax=Flavimaricola marinus TaxID=1819565 RepID=A0A238LGP4_9RHOB|nr:RraA family protein [Flavimaricola marinus]SMY08907.1 4-hydroxy-4-methyl-2-oxoglutarate aldolase [Flavimaricola marinus]
MTERLDILEVCAKELYSAVVCDTLDSIGLRDQAVAPGLEPLATDMTIFGFARVGIYMPIYHDDDQVNVYENEITLVDSLAPGEVPIISCNGNRSIAPWGELLSTRAQVLKSAGCITDGCVRDVKLIKEMGYSVFSAGRNPVDTKYRGKMMWLDVPCVIGGVTVNSGDLVIADLDGIVFVPRGRIDEVIEGALAKVRSENTVRDELRAGRSLAEVFASHGIL